MKTETEKDIFERLRDGQSITMDEPQYYKIGEAVNRAIRLSVALNTSTDTEQIRKRLGELIGQQLDNTTTVFTPFYTNVGKSITIGKRVFINHACSFLDLGGITIEDNVLIGPKVNLITENHPLHHADRRTLLVEPIIIRQNAWIGAGATILPGVTIGENAVVAAGALVTKDVPANTVVGGIPAKILKHLAESTTIV